MTEERDYYQDPIRIDLRLYNPKLALCLQKLLDEAGIESIMRELKDLSSEFDKEEIKQKIKEKAWLHELIDDYINGVHIKIPRHTGADYITKKAAIWLDDILEILGIDNNEL